LVIQPLSRAHDRNGFDCGEEALNRFLRELARQDADRDLGATFVALAEADGTKVLGYYTLAMSEVERLIVPQKNLPPERPVPVALLGRLAVNRRAQGQGLGERLLFDALLRSQQVSSHMGTFAVVVDALGESVQRFYTRYGFKPLLDDPLHLYLPMKEVRKMGLAPEKIQN